MDEDREDTIPCSWCGGTGRERCDDCHGTGHRTVNEHCRTCDGTGQTDCQWCFGAGVDAP